MRSRTLITVVLLALLGLPAAADAAPNRDPKREVVLVGNNWAGTADVVDPRTHNRIARLNVIPDLSERLAEIRADPVRLGYFLGIRELVGEGHDQFVDDMFASRDGRLIFVSRPSLADVIALEVRTGKIEWRVAVAGQRSDHMAISPDGRQLLVSASTGNVVHAIDTRSGEIAGEFASGDQPHENNYSADGKRIFHASIGSVFTPLDAPTLDGTKGERVFLIVNSSTLKVEREIDIGQELAEAGHPQMSSAVRPMTLSPDERFVYFQVSFFHGFVEYDLKQGRVTRLANLPLSAEAKSIPREGYLLDSAHHGIAMNPQGSRLCVAGTMSDYAAIVSRKTLEHEIVARGEKPYWSTNSADGDRCYVSFSGTDEVAVISYRKRREIDRFPVGDHPQRIRTGELRLGAR